jgi:hypothetical protein
MHDSGLYCYFIIPRTHTNVQKPGTYSQNKFLSPPAFWSSHGVLVFFGSLARLNRVSDLMFNAWRTAAAFAVLFPPGERGVITLAIKKDAPPSSVKEGMCDKVEQNGFSFFMLPLQIPATGRLLHLVSLFFAHARTTEGITYLLTMCVQEVGSEWISPVFFSTRKTKQMENRNSNPHSYFRLSLPDCHGAMRI